MSNFILKTLETRELKLNTIRLRGFYGGKLRKGSGGGGSGDGFPQLPGDVTRWHFGGLTNEMMAAMDDPRIEDADHKGRFLSFKNFAWGGMSGVGGYVDNWNSSADWNINNYWVNSHTDHKLQFITASTVVQARSNNIYNAENVYKNILNVNGLTEAVNKGSVGGLRIRATDPITSKAIKTFSFETDGVIQISFDDVLQDYYVDYLLYGSDTKDIDITIEQLPIYPGALVFDGVDDCGVCDNSPILTKEKGYTVVALRQWINNSTNGAYLVSNAINNGALGAFIFERDKDSITYSFGRATKISVNYNNPITYQISNSYNSVEITMGTLLKGNDTLLVGVNYKTDAYLYANVAIWELVFLDHDATEEELTKIKDYFIKTYPWLFPDQSWTVVGKTNEDEDRATIANITGNGNNLVLSNFGFAEGSGYGLYAQNYISYAITNRAVYTKTNSSIHVTKSITAGVNFTESARDVTIPSYRIKVTGIQSGQEMIYRGSNNTFLTNIPSDGIYVLPAVENGSNLGFQFVSYTGDCNITIEQIPEYEGYLVTDGVDDKAVSKQFKFGENFTVILDFKFPVKKISYCGFDLSSKVRIQNLQGSGVYVVLKGNKTLIPSNVVRAVTSEGKVYDENWNEYNIVPGNISSNYTMVNLGFDGSNQFAESATKLAGIYSSTLSKDDCIKAYNYLQTLKAK